MQVNRLFQITYLLIEHGQMTASELAERFEVSTRTIYRDLDVLSEAGIPVYAIKGKGGGIRLLPEFVISRSLLSREEQTHLLAGLQGLSAIQVPDAGTLLDKIAALFGGAGASWLEVDFSPWGGELYERERFDLLRRAVQERWVVRFLYYNAVGEHTMRAVEPLKILFKGQGWYLYAYCRTREDFRLFKLNRMESVVITEERFERLAPVQVPLSPPRGRWIKLRIRIAGTMAFRVYDEFPPSRVEKQPDGNFIVELDALDEEWIDTFVLSFGMWAEVLEPAALRERVRNRIREMGRLYTGEQGVQPFTLNLE